NEIDLASVDAAFRIDLVEIGGFGLADGRVGRGRPGIGHDIADLDLGVGRTGIVFLFGVRSACKGCRKRPRKHKSPDVAEVTGLHHRPPWYSPMAQAVLDGAASRAVGSMRR